MQEELDKRNIKIEFDAAPNPEFLNEGDALFFLKPDRIVVRERKSRRFNKSLDRPFTLNSLPIILWTFFLLK
jgi:UDPglucose 6-dehydrogenase